MNLKWSTKGGRITRLLMPCPRRSRVQHPSRLYPFLQLTSLVMSGRVTRRTPLEACCWSGRRESWAPWSTNFKNGILSYKGRLYMGANTNFMEQLIQHAHGSSIGGHLNHHTEFKGIFIGYTWNNNPSNSSGNAMYANKSNIKMLLLGFTTTFASSKVYMESHYSGLYWRLSISQGYSVL